MSAAIDLTGLAPGFSDPPTNAQTVFRQLLAAMASPGRIEHLVAAPTLSPLPNPAAAAVALTLFDFETSVHIGEDLADAGTRAWLKFHCGCKLTPDPAAADFALCTPASLLSLNAYQLGDPKYPDRSTTVIVALDRLEGGMPVTLRGPGLRAPARIAPLGLEPGFWAARADLRPLFPLGIDLILVGGDRLMALPRTTHATLQEG